MKFNGMHEYMHSMIFDLFFFFAISSTHHNWLNEEKVMWSVGPYVRVARTFVRAHTHAHRRVYACCPFVFLLQPAEKKFCSILKAQQHWFARECVSTLFHSSRHFVVCVFNLTRQINKKRRGSSLDHPLWLKVKPSSSGSPGWYLMIL